MEEGVGSMRMQWGHGESVENQLSILRGDLGDSGKDIQWH